jgi:hypothetical protein
LKNTWLFPVVQSLHVVGLAMFAGTVALADYSVLRGRAAQPAVVWTNTGLALMLATGFALFGADAARYMTNPAFLLKMGLVVVGLLFHFLGRRSSRGLSSRIRSALSLALWTAVVVSSRLVEDFDK